MVTVEDRTVGDILLELIRDPERQDWPVSNVFTDGQGLTFGSNTVIDDAFQCLPWTEGQDTIQ